MAKALVTAAVASLVLLAPSAALPRSHAAPRPLLGIVSDDMWQHESLVRLNRRTLQPVFGHRLALPGLYSGAWSYSPDRRTVALGVEGKLGTDEQPLAGLLFVDRSKPDVVRSLGFGRGSLWAIAWLAPDRLAVIVQRSGSSPMDLFVLDPAAERNVFRGTITGDPLQARRGDGRLVVLAGGPAGSSRLTVVDSRGSVRYLDLEGITGFGSALAVQPDGSRAFVVAPSGALVEVDLTSLAVSHHSLAPATRRMARVLPNGLLAVSGSNEHPCVYQGRKGVDRVPTGLQLVDTTTWTTRTIDPNASRFTVGGRSLLAGASLGCRTSGYFVCVGCKQQPPAITGSGLRAYTLAGKRRFIRFGRDDAVVTQVYGQRAYVANVGDKLAVVDLRTGRVVGRRDWEKLPILLAGRSAQG